MDSVVSRFDISMAIAHSTRTRPRRMTISKSEMGNGHKNDVHSVGSLALPKPQALLGTKFTASSLPKEEGWRFTLRGYCKEVCPRAVSGYSRLTMQTEIILSR